MLMDIFIMAISGSVMQLEFTVRSICEKKEGESIYGRISQLPNIGKMVEEQLLQVGIGSADELKRIGAKTAWLKIQEIDESACIHRLMALEGAIQGVKKKSQLIERDLYAIIPLKYPKL